jgi:hypothetical protein
MALVAARNVNQPPFDPARSNRNLDGVPFIPGLVTTKRGSRLF